MSLEDGKLGFETAAEIEKSWQTQSLLTILSRSLYMNSPGWVYHDSEEPLCGLNTKMKSTQTSLERIHYLCPMDI